MASAEALSAFVRGDKGPDADLGALLVANALVNLDVLAYGLVKKDG